VLPRRPVDGRQLHPVEHAVVDVDPVAVRQYAQVVRVVAVDPREEGAGEQHHPGRPGARYCEAYAGDRRGVEAGVAGAATCRRELFTQQGIRRLRRRAGVAVRLQPATDGGDGAAPLPGGVRGRVASPLGPATPRGRNRLPFSTRTKLGMTQVGPADPRRGSRSSTPTARRRRGKGRRSPRCRPRRAPPRCRPGGAVSGRSRRGGFPARRRSALSRCRTLNQSATSIAAFSSRPATRRGPSRTPRGP
jgi:hypothetical protein